MAEVDWLDEVRARRTARTHRLKKSARARLPFLRLTLPELIRLAEDRLPSPALILHLEMIRLSGLFTVQKQDGWTVLDSPSLKSLGLVDKQVRHRAVEFLVMVDYLQTRGRPGHKLEYRLNPHWAAPRAKLTKTPA